MYSISNYLFATKLSRGNLFLVQDNIIMGYLRALTKGYLNLHFITDQIIFSLTLCYYVLFTLEAKLEFIHIMLSRQL